MKSCHPYLCLWFWFGLVSFVVISKDYPHLDYHTKQITDTPGFKPFTMILLYHKKLPSALYCHCHVTTEKSAEFIVFYRPLHHVGRQNKDFGRFHLPEEILFCLPTWRMSQGSTVIWLGRRRRKFSCQFIVYDLFKPVQL